MFEFHKISLFSDNEARLYFWTHRRQTISYVAVALEQKLENPPPDARRRHNFVYVSRRYYQTRDKISSNDRSKKTGKQTFIRDHVVSYASKAYEGRRKNHTAVNYICSIWYAEHLIRLNSFDWNLLLFLLKVFLSSFR